MDKLTIKHDIGAKYKLRITPQKYRNQCEICKSAMAVGHLSDYVKYKIRYICLGCTDKYNLGSDDVDKRRAGLALMKMKKLI